MANPDQLIQAIAPRGVVAAKVLADALGVSQPTISRLVRAAADKICVLGHARATRYALRRSIAGLPPQLPIRIVDEQGSAASHATLHLLADYRHWLQRPDGRGELFAGLPPFVEEMRPQGYMGRHFSAIYPELGLPLRITDWSNDQRLIALSRRGEDCVGNLILGDESFTRFLAAEVEPVERRAYPELAQRSLLGQPGSSAGGEQPKFAVFSGGNHVLVKFAKGEPGAVTQRWQDLLICEHEALRSVEAAGLEASASEWFDIDGVRFLQLPRFDRVGQRGRRGVVSLYALAGEHLGYLENWNRAAKDLHQQGLLSAEDARRICWLDTFGQLIGNTDRHFGNLTFFHSDGALTLAPAYDMLPTIFVPQDTNIVERPFAPRQPTAENHDVWATAARHAVEYWGRLEKLEQLDHKLRKTCRECGDRVRNLMSGGS